VSINHLHGDCPSLTAALSLLRKVLPDLAAVEHSGTIENKQPSTSSSA
jgi:hypothetical protein